MSELRIRGCIEMSLREGDHSSACIAEGFPGFLKIIDFLTFWKIEFFINIISLSKLKNKKDLISL